MAAITATPSQIALVFPSRARVRDVVLAEAVTAGQSIYQANTGKYGLADANAAGKEQFRGVALSKGAAGQTITICEEGEVAGYDLSGVAYDGAVFLSDTAGGLDSAASATKTVRCGRVVALTDPELTKVVYIKAEPTAAW